ncbi:MAG: hypothetical protein F4Z97_00770 [Gammaproteobacteria bacterium]|nr:hypothetical protein [Gammaproteobacteria bacterium]MYI90244.1 hypothetical protein [Gammaproteobacteria bacterium]
MLRAQRRSVRRPFTRAIRARWIDTHFRCAPRLEGVDEIKLVHFEDLDILPCGENHVADTMKIGEVKMDKIESTEKRNRRVSNSLVDTAVEPNH